MTIDILVFLFGFVRGPALQKMCVCVCVLRTLGVFRHMERNELSAGHSGKMGDLRVRRMLAWHRNVNHNYSFGGGDLGSKHSF